MHDDVLTINQANLLLHKTKKSTIRQYVNIIDISKEHRSTRRERERERERERDREIERSRSEFKKIR